MRFELIRTLQVDKKFDILKTNTFLLATGITLDYLS